MFLNSRSRLAAAVAITPETNCTTNKAYMYGRKVAPPAGSAADPLPWGRRSPLTPSPPFLEKSNSWI